MTPEERSRDLFADLAMRNLAWYGEDSTALHAAIAAAIRAAENDALERAAALCDERAITAERADDANRNDIEYGKCSAYGDAAESIRALKHKDVE